MTSNSDEQITTNEIENRELLYSLYMELMEEIINKKLNIENDEYIKKIATTSISTLISYIKESINLVVNKRLENIRNEENKKNSIKSINENDFENEFKKYENQLRYLENQIRYFAKKNLQFKIEKDTLEAKIRAYMEIKDEYDEMREKLRYEDGKFMDNDRKDNEIEILRKENSNLKEAIKKLEKDKKYYETKIKKDEEKINELKSQLETLENKVTILLENQNDTTKNSHINININNNLNQSSKLIIKQDETSKSTKLVKRHSHYNHHHNDSDKSENLLSDIINNKTSINSNYKNSIYGTRQKKRTNSTNSVNEETRKFDLLSKYCSNNNLFKNKSNAGKIVKRTLYSIHKKQKYEDFISYISKIYLNGGRASKSANRSTLRKKEKEKEKDKEKEKEKERSNN